MTATFPDKRSKVERVAQAIYDAYDRLGAGHRTAFINLSESEQKIYLSLAQAAIDEITRER